MAYLYIHKTSSIVVYYFIIYYNTNKSTINNRENNTFLDLHIRQALKYDFQDIIEIIDELHL